MEKVLECIEMLLALYNRIKSFLGLGVVRLTKSQTMLYNIVYSWQLEFGQEWGKSIQQKIDERISFLTDDEKQNLGKLIDKASKDIGRRISEALDSAERGALKKAKKEIKKRYPWLSNRNLWHEINQAKYYKAMH